MDSVFVLLYIHTDEPEHSEILGAYKDKYTAVNELLERANYRERNGKLTQYMEPTDEYDSLEALRRQVCNQMELVDVDIYRIQQVLTQ